MKSTLRVIGAAIAWVAGVFMIIGGVATVIQAGLAALIISLGGLLLLPPVLRRVSKLFGGRVWPGLAIALALIVIVGPVALAISQPTEEERAARQELRDAQRVADAEVEAKRAEERRLAAAEKERRRDEENKRKEAEKRVRDCSDMSMAYIMSRRFVERSLLAPSTAKFPSFHSDGVRVAQTGLCKFQVVAYVDAQNGFGAMIRSRYVIDMEYLPESKSWRGMNLSM